MHTPAGIGDFRTLTAAGKRGLSFDQIVYKNVYKGIDVLYRERNNHLEFVFIIRPGANPNQIRMAYSAVEGEGPSMLPSPGGEGPGVRGGGGAGTSVALRLDARNNLQITLPTGNNVVQQAPIAFQKLNAARHDVRIRPVLTANGQLRFKVGPYNHRRTLIIDPGMNNPPMAGNDSYSILHDHQLSVSSIAGVLANDTDMDLDTLTAILVSNPSHGALTLNSNGSFTYTPATGFAGSDSFTYKANDGTADSNTATVSITVNNNAPSAGNVWYSSQHDRVLNVSAPGVLALAIDTDGDPLTAVLATNPSHGSVTLNSNGSFSYTPTAGYVGGDSFTFYANDGVTNSSAATATITVTNTSTPTAEDDEYTVLHDQFLIVESADGLLDNDSDADGDTLSAVLVTGPSHGTVWDFGPDGGFSYSPDEQFVGSDSFTYQAFDGAATGSTTTVTITVTNTAPTASNETYGVQADSSIDVAALTGVLANDADADGDCIIASLVTDVSHGTLVLNEDGSFTYEADAEFVGNDSFTYTANDGVADCTAATVTLVVHGSNQAPTGTNDSYTLVHDTYLWIDPLGVLANDSDAESDPLSSIVASAPSHGELTLYPDGTFYYLPEVNYVGEDSFTYLANDGADDSDPNTVTITVSNSAPIADDDDYGVQFETATAISALFGLLGNDTDADGDFLAAVLVAEPAHGSLTLEDDGSFSYTPDQNFTGADSFTYKVSDGIDESNTETVTLNVHAANVSPVAGNEEYATLHDTMLSVEMPGVLANDTDEDLDQLTAVLATGPSHGTLTLNEDGSFNYTPDEDFVGADSFTYYANDGADDSDDPATVTIDVTNDEPGAGDASYTILHDQTLTVGSPGVLDGTFDPNDDAVTASLVNDVSHGTLTLNADGSFEYIPNEGFAGIDSFAFVATDGLADSAEATVFVYVTNQVPFAAIDIYSTPAGQTLNVSAAGVLGNDYDADDDVLSAAVVAAPSHGSLTLYSDGSFGYTPDSGYTGNDTFSYEASDGIDTSETALVTISVVGSAPIANDDEYVALPNETLSIDAPGVLENDFAPSTYALTVASYTEPTHGQLALYEDGHFTYAPYEDYEGDDSFTYYAEANSIASAQEATVTIRVVRIGLAGQQYIPVNANNHNNSSMARPEIPRKRDFSYLPTDPGGTDPNLIQVNVTVGANMPAGFFVLSVIYNGNVFENGNHTGEIRLWKRREKGSENLITVPGVFSAAGMPRFFYVEGLEPSENENETIIRLEWFSINGLGAPVARVARNLSLTVTPVITASSLNTATGGNGGIRFIMGNNGLRGMAAGQPFGNLNFPNQNPGARFSATLKVNGLAVSASSGALFVQNFLAIDEGSPGAYAYNNGRVGHYVLTQGGGFRLLDKVGTQQSPPPDYINPGGIHPTGATGGVLTITDADTPLAGYQDRSKILGNLPFPQFLTNIDFTYRFRVHLMWRFPAIQNGSGSVIYSLASAEWQARFVAGTFVLGQGVTTINAGSGITVNANFGRNHSNPVVQRPTFNSSAKIGPG